MSGKTWDRLMALLRWLAAAIFIFAGISKILHPVTFARNIDNYRLLPYLFVTLMAIILPWLELLSGILLIIGKWKKGAALILLALSLVFLIAISTAIARGLDITCGCFAISSQGAKVGYTRLVEDFILFGSILLINIKLAKE